MTDKQPEALIRADELEAIGAESGLARAMAAHTIRLLYKEKAELVEALKSILDEPKQTMSDAKALKEIVRITKAAFAKAQGENNV